MATIQEGKAAPAFTLEDAHEQHPIREASG